MEKRLNGLVSKAIKNDGIVNDSEIKEIFKENELNAVYNALEEAGIDVLVDVAEDDEEEIQWDESKSPMTDNINFI